MAHLKTIATPKTWPVKRKEKKYILRPSPGSHNLDTCLSLNFVMINMLEISKTKKESIYILHNKEILVDGIKRKEVSFPVGLFDVITVKDTKKNFRLVLNEKGRFDLLEIDNKEAGIKPFRVTGKKMAGKKVQLSLFDGRNILVPKTEVKVGDTITLKDKKVKDHYKLEKGNTIFLTGGNNLGTVGVVEDVVGSKIIYRRGDVVSETLKSYAFVIGKDKPIIKLK